MKYYITEMLRLITAALMYFHCPAPDFHANLTYWQHELQLEDWRVSLYVVPAEELSRNVVGEMDIVAQEKSVTIRILREQDSDLPRRLARADQQLTLVHRLVHLKRMVNGDAWHNEAETVAQTTALVRSHHRWREAAAIEGLY